MCDSIYEPIRPVIDKHAVIGRVVKRGFGNRGKRRCPPGFGQSMGQEVIGNTAVRFLDLCSPFYVPPKIGRLSLEDG